MFETKATEYFLIQVYRAYYEKSKLKTNLGYFAGKWALPTKLMQSLSENNQLGCVKTA